MLIVLFTNNNMQIASIGSAFAASLHIYSLIISDSCMASDIGYIRNCDPGSTTGDY